MGLGLLAKRRLGIFLLRIADAADDGRLTGSDFPRGMTTEALFSHFEVMEAADVIGHAMALYTDDE